MGKRIAAIVGLAIIAMLYIASLITALLATPVSHQMFLASAVATVFIPVILWIYIRLYERAQEKDGDGMTMRDIKKINKRIKAGEDPNEIAREIEEGMKK